MLKQVQHDRGGDKSCALSHFHAGKPHEVSQHRVAMFGRDALRVELYTVDGKIRVAETHNMAVVGRGVDDQAVWDVLDNQAMIARCGEGRGQASE